MVSQVQRKSVSYRINLERLKEDIHRSSVLSNVNGSANELMDRYLTGIKILLEVHAPLIQRTITPRQNAPWYTEEYGTLGVSEDRWRESGDTVSPMLIKGNIETNALYWPNN